MKYLFENRSVGLLVDLGLTSQQQLRSYVDGTSVYSLVRQTSEARYRTCDKANDITTAARKLLLKIDVYRDLSVCS